MTEKEKPRIQVATHEAAHAVVAEMLDIKVLNIVVNDQDGYCEYEPCDRSGFIWAIVALAGSCAEQVFFQQQKDEFDESDYLEAVENIGGDRNDIQVLSHLVRHLVRDVKDQIRKKAESLL